MHSVTEEECGDIMNNPVEIEDFEAVKNENDHACYDAGKEDGEAGKPFNRDLVDVANSMVLAMVIEGDTNLQQASCELLIEGHELYCPDHPDIAARVGFLVQYNPGNT